MGRTLIAGIGLAAVVLTAWFVGSQDASPPPERGRQLPAGPSTSREQPSSRLPVVETRVELMPSLGKTAGPAPTGIPAEDESAAELPPPETGPQLPVVKGRVIAPDGEPCAAELWWRDVSQEKSHRRGRKWRAMEPAGADGLFLWSSSRTGTYVLRAIGVRAVNDGASPGTASFTFADTLPPAETIPRRRILGVALSRPVTIIHGIPVPPITLRLEVGGRIHGLVQDAQGAPAAGVALRATLDGRRKLEWHSEDDGLTTAFTFTDVGGAFAFEGLAHGAYHLERVRETWPGLFRDDESLTPRPVPVDGPPLTLRLSRPHLLIRLRTVDGSMPEVTVAGRRDAPKGAPHEPGLPELFVTRAAGGLPRGAMPGPRFAQRPAIPRWVGGGDWIVELADGEGDVGLEFDVGLLGGGQPWAPRRVHVPAGAGRVVVELDVSTPREPGVLVVDAVDDHGAPIRDRLCVSVVDPELGTVLVSVPITEASEDTWPLRLPLPAGGYELAVEGFPVIQGWHASVTHPRDHGGSVLTVGVSSGAETHVTAHVELAAWLRVRVEGAPAPGVEQLVAPLWGGTGHERSESINERIVEQASSVFLTLERPGRAVQALPISRLRNEGSSAQGVLPEAEIRFGDEATSDALTPGRYTLVARTPEGREVRREVELPPGTTTSVTLVFD